MIATFVNALLSAAADAVCGASYGTASPGRVNRRNGYRHRDFDTRTGTGEFDAFGPEPVEKLGSCAAEGFGASR